MVGARPGDPALLTVWAPSLRAFWSWGPSGLLCLPRVWVLLGQAEEGTVPQGEGPKCLNLERPGTSSWVPET